MKNIQQVIDELTTSGSTPGMEKPLGWKRRKKKRKKKFSRKIPWGVTPRKEHTVSRKEVIDRLLGEQ